MQLGFVSAIFGDLSLEEVLAFARAEVDWPYIQHPTPYPGTPMTKEFRARGLVVDENTCRPLSAGDRLDYDLAVDVLMQRVATLNPDGRAIPREHPRSLQASAQLEPA